MRFTTAAEAVKLICPHSSVYIQGSTSIPEVLVRAMTDRAAELTDVTLYSGFAVGRADAPIAAPNTRIRSWSTACSWPITSAAGWPRATDSRPRPSWAKSQGCSATGRCPSTWQSSTSRAPTRRATARSASRPTWPFRPWNAPGQSSRRSTRPCRSPTATP